MTSRLLAFTFCLAFSPLLVAQQAASSIEAPTNTSKPVVLSKGTEVVFALLESVSTATAKNGQEVRLAVANDVEVNGSIVIPKGTHATGKVTQLRKAIAGKRDGSFSIKPISLTLTDGKQLKLREHPPDACEPDGPCWLLNALAMPFYPLLLIHDAADRSDNDNLESGKEFIAEECSPQWGFLAAHVSVPLSNLGSSNQSSSVDSTLLVACVAQGKFKYSY
ncbi:MAG: hypothetical protein WBP85_12300 [Terracidiphilus sp.]